MPLGKKFCKVSYMYMAYQLDGFSFADAAPGPAAKCPGVGGWDVWVAVRGGGGIAVPPSAFKTEMHFQFSR